MPNFQAKERDETLAAAKPGEAPPAVDINHFGLNSAAGSALHREFTYG